ncbi:histidine N-acetyltransferase [Branchiostoma belcheri]|nr:histidine N-acetyltransferase [Branchiostoma belcheri]
MQRSRHVLSSRSVSFPFRFRVGVHSSTGGRASRGCWAEWGVCLPTKSKKVFPRQHADTRRDMANQNSLHLTYREATHSDYDAVMNMASVDTFRDGFDWLPTKFHQCVDDPDVIMFVAEANDKVVGLYVSIITDGGANVLSKTIRIAPELQGKKMQSKMAAGLDTTLRHTHPQLWKLEVHALTDVKRLYLTKVFPNKKDICFMDAMYFQGMSNEVLDSLETKDVLPSSPHPPVVPYQPSDMARLARPEFSKQILLGGMALWRNVRLGVSAYLRNRQMNLYPRQHDARRGVANQDSFHLTCREATHSDHDAVMNIASVDTFRDGFDYLPAKFDQWVDDPDVKVLVGEADDKVLGMYVSIITDGGANLLSKTIRIAPELQGKKFMTKLIVELHKALQLRYPGLLQLEQRNLDVMYFQGKSNEVLDSLETKDVLPPPPYPPVVPYQPSDMARLARPEFSHQGVLGVKVTKGSVSPIGSGSELRC